MRFPMGLLAPYTDDSEWPHNPTGLLSPYAQMVLSANPGTGPLATPANATDGARSVPPAGYSDGGLLSQGQPDYTLGSRGLNDNNNGAGMTETPTGSFGPMSARTARMAGGNTDTAQSPSMMSQGQPAQAQSPYGDLSGSPYGQPMTMAAQAPSQGVQMPPQQRGSQQPFGSLDRNAFPSPYGAVDRTASFTPPAQLGGYNETTALEGGPEQLAYLYKQKNSPDLPSQNATPAGGAPFNAPQQPKADDPGFLEKLTGALGGIYGQGGPGDGLINLGLALMSPGNKAENVMKAGQMAQLNDYKKSQLLAAQQKQQRETLALQGNMQTLKKAYPDWTPEQLAAAAQNPSLVQEAVKTINPSEVSRTLTDPAERAKFGIRPDDTTLYQVDRTGKLTSPGKPAVSVDMRGENSFSTEAGQLQAKRFNGYIAGADKAQGAIGDINNLREMSRRLGSQGATADFKRMIGPYAEAAGVNIEGLPDIQAFNSVIQKLAPQMHVAGSGATSDIEFKGMLSALPQLSANPAAREAILNTMEAQQRRAMAQGDIAAKVFNGDMTKAEGEKALREMPDPMTAFRTFRAQNPDAFANAPQAGTPASQAQPQYTPDQIQAEIARRGLRK
ncbi:MAG: hypothetical protein JWM36_4734 [Hyphomicrobiales bacterium]|nr:hypothetical protein [Hyphomicrobiales bacterium]